MTDHSRVGSMMNETVHAGLRRDIRRLRVAFDEPAAPGADRRAALADHVSWMAAFLRRHHQGEDSEVWPRVRAKAPDLEPLLEQMETEHEAMADALVALEAAATAWRNDGSVAARTAVSGNVDRFGAVCLSHLDHEEQEGIPQVVAVLDDDDWVAIGKVMRGRPSLSEGGFTLMWMLDGLDTPHTEVLEAQIPAPVMWLLKRRFGPRYATRRALLWGRAPVA